MKKCKTCGANCEKEYCFKHKPRKPLKNSGKITMYVGKESYDVFEMTYFFLGIWNKRKHVSEISGENLGNEPLTVFFHHILPKNKHEMAKLDEENIILITWAEHDQVELDESRYPEINKRREQLKLKYNL
jgi:hypothetical protein